MSSRSILQDDQQFLPGSTVTKWGRYFSLSSNGLNQVAGDEVLVPHPYTLLLTDRCNALFSMTRCSGAAGVSYGQVECTATAKRAWSVSDDYELYGKLEAAFDKGEFNAYVFAGELGESVDMLADRAKQLARAVKAAKRGRFAQAAYILGVGGERKVSPTTRKRHRDDAGPQDPQKVSNGWLELQYGWKPLMGEIYTLSVQIANLDKPRTRRIFARQKIPMIPSCTSPTLFDVSGSGRVSKQIVAYITENIPKWDEALGLADPELVFWEIVPFSFVADWFIPIGGWLQARAFAQRAKGTFVITTTTKYHVRLKQPKQLPCTGTWGRIQLSSAGWKRHVSMSRTVTSSLPQVPLPSFGNGLFGSPLRLANAFALLVGIFRNFRLK